MRPMLHAAALSLACAAGLATAATTTPRPVMPVLPPPDITLSASQSAPAADVPAAARTPATPPTVADPTPSQLDHALAGDWRSAANVARDQYRHPRETLAFFGLRDDQTVIEIWPSGGWYADVLAPTLREHGHYIGILPRASSAGNDKQQASTQRGNDALRAQFAKRADVFDKAELRESDDASPDLGPPGSADLVLTFRNVHNWVMAGNEQAMFKAFFNVLKPGGTLGVVDHRAAADQPPAEMKTSGYLPEAYVIALAEAAGFRLAGKSEINANPRDTKDYPGGVWTLPPRLAKGDVDRAKYLAIGESDRMTLRFVKP
jgi:predicted methyltransferase